MTHGWGEGEKKKHVIVLLGAMLSMATANFGEMRGSTLPSGIFKLVKSSVGPEPATTNYSIGYSGTSVKADCRDSEQRIATTPSESEKIKQSPRMLPAPNASGKGFLYHQHSQHDHLSVGYTYMPNESLFQC